MYNQLLTIISLAESNTALEIFRVKNMSVHNDPNTVICWGTIPFNLMFDDIFYANDVQQNIQTMTASGWKHKRRMRFLPFPIKWSYSYIYRFFGHRQ